ncbi:hypothetical protein [Ornithinibacillus halotolerans]|uniref:Uncharacterized protein n=1 Tax=Ornithinibacillus halotolerans TaxID=1274357 RepID=A0A916S2J2_9BACI|nr:hypothetical protein [Ornithinibacillus halotolerans]GGA78516.1 hypothetical protein GCM10008025_22490 [Ornithinibacillus halotolerans]
MFSNEQLKAMIEGKVVGTEFPYDTNNDQEIEAHIRRLFYRINRIPNIVCEAEWNHFGSGYASFVEFFCYQKEDVEVTKEIKGIQELEIEGIIIDISRLAPVAIMGEDDRYKTIRVETKEEIGGAYGSLLGGYRLEHLPDKYREIARKLRQALEEYNYELLKPEVLNERLPFPAQIPTIYREPRQYLILDAIFYWID